MRLFVVCGSPPESSRRCSPLTRTTAQPPGPGLPETAPSGTSSTSGPRPQPSAICEHELAVLLAGLEPPLRRLHVLERPHRVDERPDAPLREEARDGAELRVAGHRRAEHVELLPEDAVQARGRIAARRRARDHEAPAAAQRLDRGRPGVGADVLVDDVGAAAARQLPHRREHVVAAVVDGRVRASLARDGQHLVARGRRDHARPERRGERHGGAADARAGAPHEDPLAGLQARARHQHAPGGGEHERIGGGLGEAQRLGLRVQVAHGHDAVVGVRARAGARRAPRSARTATAGRAGRPRRRRRRCPG